MSSVGILFLLLALLIILAGSIFWVWMLVECATKESNSGNDKVVWIIIILFAHFVGALIYFFARRPRRYAEIGR
jgi:hypothetical protein